MYPVGCTQGGDGGRMCVNTVNMVFCTKPVRFGFVKLRIYCSLCHAVILWVRGVYGVELVGVESQGREQSEGPSL